MKSSIPIIGPENKSKSFAVNPQETINLVQSPKTPAHKSQYILETINGFTLKDNLTSSSLRNSRTPQLKSGRLRGFDELYMVIGDKLIGATGIDDLELVSGNYITDTLLPDFPDSIGLAQIAVGRNYLLVITNSNAYTWDGSGPLESVSDNDLPARVSSPIYKDGYFIVIDVDTDDFYISAFEDPTTWNALDFGSAREKPDLSVAAAVDGNYLWILGTETAQAYYNSGNADFPYTLITNSTKKIGVLSPYTITESRFGLFFLATSQHGGRFIYLINGLQGQKISSDDIDYVLEGIEDVADVTAYIYEYEGKAFYVLNFGPSSADPSKRSFTYVYNINAGQWEKREDGRGEAWPFDGCGALNGVPYFLSDGRIYAFTKENYRFLDTGGATFSNIPRIRTTQVYHNNDHYIEWLELVIDVTVGEEKKEDFLPTPDELYMEVRFSDDGYNYGDWLQLPLGLYGERNKRLTLHGLGISRKRIFQFRYSGNSYFAIIAAYANVRVLND
jgi:hypothetical protein